MDAGRPGRGDLGHFVVDGVEGVRRDDRAGHHDVTVPSVNVSGGDVARVS